jgi:dTDP-4-dehydrorhamnose 3,5-epimerase-like enzyme
MTESAQSIQLDRKKLPFGTLGVIEFSSLDFDPARVYWISDVPHGAERGHHAHKDLTQQICVLAGSVEIEIWEGILKKTFFLNQDSMSLRLKPGLWRVLRNFSENACVLVLCDKPYDESDYIRSFDAYLDWLSDRND